MMWRVNKTLSVELYEDTMCTQNLVSGIIWGYDVYTKPRQWHHCHACVHKTSSVESYEDAMCTQNIINAITIYVLSISWDAWSNSGGNVLGIRPFLRVFNYCTGTSFPRILPWRSWERGWFWYSLTGACFSVSSKSSFTGTTIRAASVLTIGIDITDRNWSITLVHIFKVNSKQSIQVIALRVARTFI